MSALYSPNDPIAAIATALSPAAIGMVRTSGAGSVEMVSSVFSRPKALLQAAGNTIVHGWIIDDEIVSGRSTRERIDEVMVSVYRAPHSFTGEEAAEITCHGGVAVVKAVMQRLLAAGFRQAERGEFTFRAYINGKTDLTRAEAVCEIIDSRTAAAASHAASRLGGTLFDEVMAIKSLLLDAIAKITVQVEYPEDESAGDGVLDAKSLQEANRRLQILESTWASQRLYQDGAKMVLCGAPNAGKSSLFNTLLKEDRAIVSPVAGTTRDWIEASADFGGIPVTLFDTAGLRISDNAIEAEGVRRTQSLTNTADVVLYVVDGTRGMTAEDTEFLTSHSDMRCIVLWNKMDISHNMEHKNIDAIPISCRTGEGIKQLVSAIHDTLIKCGTLSISENRAASIAALGSDREHDAVTGAMACVTHALDAAAIGYPLDAVAENINDALEQLALLTGEVEPMDVLESVFARFCVGK